MSGGASPPSASLCEATTATNATVAPRLKPTKTEKKQLGSVGERKQFVRHQLALVCTGASVRLGRGCTNTPTHGEVADVPLDVMRDSKNDMKKQNKRKHNKTDWCCAATFKVCKRKE